MPVIYHEGYSLGDAGGGGGHTIINSSGTAVTQRDGLQFSGMNVTDDSTNNRTVIQGQVKVCETQAAWNQLSQAEKDDPNTYWFLPWLTNITGSIDDSTTAADKVWSSQKTSSTINVLKSKTVVGSSVTVGSYSALQTALLNKAATMDAYSIENMVVACSAVFTELPLGGNYAVQIYKGSNSYLSVILHSYNSPDYIYRMTYYGNVWNFSTMGTIASWKYYGTVTPTTTTQEIYVSTSASEFLIAYGSANNGQVYGGGTVVLSNNYAAENVVCVPIYTNLSNSIKCMVTFYVNPVGTIRCAAGAITSGFTPYIKIWYR